jgi:1-acyl-sn-glycerol-3-phosphate acyltransferase
MVYRLLAMLLSPLERWGRVHVDGLELVPRIGPVLLVPTHDSQMDPVLIGLALRALRPIRFLARSSLWQIPGLGPLLNGLGQVAIRRGAGDHAAIARAVSILHTGEAVCVFPEGRLSRGEVLRARTGIVRLWSACPDARVVSCAITGATDYVRFPRRPRVAIRFLEPTGGQPSADEDPRALAARLLADARSLAAPVAAGRRHRHAARPGDTRDAREPAEPLGWPQSRRARRAATGI